MANETALEERRKKATLRKIERKHAGKVTQPYAIMERLIAEVESFAPLKRARFCLLWKSGWKTDVDGVLTRAQVSKCSEAEREIWGDFDYTIRLHRELWALKCFKDEDREMDIFHELLHCQPELDEEGEQKKDERDRLCWRVRRRHPIQEFPEVIERYGLEKSTGMNAEALKALDDEQARREAEADANDANRPLLNGAGANGNGSAAWRPRDVSHLGLSDKLADKLRGAGCGTLGELVDRMRAKKEFWFRDLKGIGAETAATIADALAAFQKKHPEYADL